jgi:hypothetical protein|nr:MAG TPA: hypothetical protein [Bacteriophage sp.]DAY34901.1 MAG TPA: hypothetical protein [Bacteriophage sp.]
MEKELLLSQIEDLKRHCRNLQNNIQEMLQNENQGCAMALMDDLQDAEFLIDMKKSEVEKLESEGQ